jgi:hypothetical protein
MQSKEDIQTEFNRLVNRGIILGCVWILGVGSVISLISAYQANKLINNSVIIGIAGLLIWVAAIIIILVFRKK